MESVSWDLQARDSLTALRVLFTLALARKILESIRACSYEMAYRNHVIWSLARTLARLICQVSLPAVNGQ